MRSACDAAIIRVIASSLSTHTWLASISDSFLSSPHSITDYREGLLT